MKKERKAFMRIDMARLAKDYPFKPQRMAVAANMYRRWIERQLK